MRLKKFIAAFLSVLMLLTSSTFAQNGERLPKLKIKEYRLKNGLRVVLHEDKSTPIVAVNLWYHVGSKNEVVGRTGFAHLFEHMMFQGSKNYNDDYFKPLQEVGATINGSTNPDRTNYFQVLPSNFLELALFMEADRMGGLLEAMTQEKLDNQRDVVKNERRQRYDNQPYGTAFEKIFANIYPKDHPYNWTTIGSLEDLSAASMEDVKAFFRTYYVPNNATLAIAGDFNEKQAREWVAKYFGPIPAGDPIKRPNPAAPKISGEVRKSFEDSVQLPRLYMVWTSSAANSADEPALDILSSVLSSGRGSRLQSNLIFGKQLAQDASAFNYALEIAGKFIIQSTARPGKTLAEIETEINNEIKRIQDAPPTAEEMSRALNSIEAQTIFGIQNVLGKADQLNGYATYRNKPDSFQEDLDRYRKVTAADVQRVAKQYLNGDRFVMEFVPRKERVASQRDGRVNQPTSTSAKKSEDKKDYSANLPKGQPDPKLTLPSIQKAKLTNGLNVWMVQSKELPIVSMNMVINAGGAADPADRSGLAYLTAALLDDGTKTRSAVDIANQLQSIGANLGTGSSWDSASATMQTLTKNLDKALEIYSDVLVNATYPAEEVENRRRRDLVGFVQRKDNPNAIANIAYSRLLYGDHPYARSLQGDEKSIKAVTRAEIEDFYAKYYRPNNSTLVVVGDFEPKTLTQKLEAAFKDWKPADAPVVSLPAPKQFERPGIYLIDKPGAAQSVVSIGQIGVARDNPDYFPLLVMNSILGGQFSARVNMNLREEKGYTYGARTSWGFRKGAGPFEASADVQTAVTKESVMEFMKELNGIRGAIPVTQQELDYNKQSLIRRYPAGFETNGQIAGQLANLITYGLPDSYFNEYIGKIQSVTLADVNRVANKYLQPDNMAILIVGDKSVIEPKLKEIEGWGNKISYLDPEGNTLK
ncbi:MAG: pitrilysin family protein [Pyrinomonadaceae bacterium]|nr:pitrilysin family protein [Pyrinomonadaceae bacterium]